MNKTLKAALALSISHCIIGNIVGVSSETNLLDTLLLPYSFIAGLSAFAGWDGLSHTLEIVSLVICTAIFYGLIVLVKQVRAE